MAIAASARLVLPCIYQFLFLSCINFLTLLSEAVSYQEYIPHLCAASLDSERGEYLAHDSCDRRIMSYKHYKFSSSACFQSYPASRLALLQFFHPKWLYQEEDSVKIQFCSNPTSLMAVLLFWTLPSIEVSRKATYSHSIWDRATNRDILTVLLSALSAMVTNSP